jgi:hypothetical protein
MRVLHRVIIFKAYTNKHTWYHLFLLYIYYMELQLLEILEDKIKTLESVISRITRGEKIKY